MGAFLFALVFVILVGLAFALIGWAALSLVITFGVFSLSALIAWYNKSVSLGAKWFLQLIFAVPGMMVGVLGCFVYQWLFDKSLTLSFILLMGITIGALGGFIAGTIAFYIIRRLFRNASSGVK